MQRSRRVIGLLGCIVILSGCGGKTAKTGDGEVARPVRVEKVERADIDMALVYGTELLPSTEVKLFSTVMDRILSFPVEDGDTVSKGDVLVMVRREGMDRGLEQLGAQAAAQDAQLRNLASELERTRDLFAKGVATRQTLDQVQTAHEAAVAQRKALLAGRGQLAATASNAVIKAPISGVFASKMLEVGDIASPAAPLGRILVVDPLKLELKLVEADVSRVRMGQDVELIVDAWPGRRFTGRITRILPYLDAETRTNTVEVTIANPKTPAGEFELKPGMYGRARLITDRRTGVLVAPDEALLLDTRLDAQAAPGELLRRAVVATDNGTASLRIVKLGVRDGSRWEILDGLNDGERLVVRGHHGLKDGQRVKVVGEDAR